MDIFVVIAIVGFLGVFVYAFMRKSASTKYFHELAKTKRFRIISLKNEVFKIKGFENIICRDFIGGNVSNVEIKRGAIRYQVEGATVICDCNIKEDTKDTKGTMVSSVVLHLNSTNPKTFATRIRLRPRFKSQENPQGYMSDLNFPLTGVKSDLSDRFIVTADKEIGLENIPEKLRTNLCQYLDNFPLKSPSQKGLIVINPKGWLLLSIPCRNKNNFESLLALDKRIGESIL